jgi:hypothetical protein
MIAVIRSAAILDRLDTGLCAGRPDSLVVRASHLCAGHQRLKVGRADAPNSKRTNAIL